MKRVDPARLSLIFGPESVGDTPEARARTSDRLYVRSQVQLAADSPNATGRRLNALEALNIFGLDTLEKVAENGGANIITDPNQPADTFRKRREFLNLSEHSIAVSLGLDTQNVIDAETPGRVSRIRDLEQIAQALALDERVLGYRAEALGDKKLGARLRDLDPSEHNEAFIVALADAAWVIGRQMELSRRLGKKNLVDRFGVKLNKYDKPTYKTGYELAERSRAMLGLSPTDPIPSVRHVTEVLLGIPVVVTDLGPSVAGSTIINGKALGIALGTVASNRRPLVRRMTLAHELGHLLWDPEAVLTRVRIERADQVGHRQRDPVEIRANAFGISFLAPREAVWNIYEKYSPAGKAALMLALEYGINLSAAVYHMESICDIKLGQIDYKLKDEDYRRWEEVEGPMIEVVPGLPMSRAGRFLSLVKEAMREGLINADTAASWLRADRGALQNII